MGWKWPTSQLLLKIHVTHVTTSLILVLETSLLPFSSRNHENAVCAACTLRLFGGAARTGERQISPFAEVVATCEQNACSRLAARWYCSAGWAHQRTLPHNVPSSNGSELPAGTAKKVPEEAGSRTHNSPRAFSPSMGRDAVVGILLKAVRRRSACPRTAPYKQRVAGQAEGRRQPLRQIRRRLRPLRHLRPLRRLRRRCSRAWHSRA